MIDAEFNGGAIDTINFGVCLRSNGNMYFVPTDVGTKDALRAIYRDTVAAFGGIQTDWEAYDISEDYGARRRIYANRASEFMADLSAIFDAGALDDIANLQHHTGDIDYYFAEFTDDQNRRAVGIRKATRFKGTIKARNRLVRLVDDTLVLIEEDVLRLDQEFDLIVTDAHVYILNVNPMEHLANIVANVAATAAAKVQVIHDTITFLDLSRIRDQIGGHPRVARQAASVAANPNLAAFQRAPIEALAAQHGIKFRELEDGRLQCRVQDHAKLIELLDARRYHLDLAGNGGDPYRASGRQKVSAAE
ncbi:DUF4868 domain-containing protein [Mesorhizobium sp. C416B]|uniref:Kiwa anti-phage protein KwaB-like domain-containing protein n=1 Tax=unclassified Mesorhizobium TaxID=325217 RepID=UPI0003CF1CAD|nr:MULTISPECIES: Kiwa anti-phage protein KwaB-like domain-containing protein [unclassified Mesorhizobium]ESX41129.1 hypothetical protein X762_30320 [Mesorhizobium sp. LSHC426A00]ESX45423.1 hypothetical protein X761_32175 [Mesorhizobium sp. LSHC424B00]ESX64358.1 hypothetical protein X758_31790 [Mesorhizobium sp. LSHC416B00]WJI65685.1 DUF4868 domain-containing protein [Mesorhizobium sp. C416B]